MEDNNLQINNILNEEPKQKIRNKKIVYENERKIILNKMYEIVGLNDKNYFYSTDINDSKIIQNQILEMSDDIKKYYATSTWSVFKKSVDVENIALSIIKSLLKDNNVLYESKTQKIIVNGKKKISTLYTVQK
jgi:hypothetical protein